MENLTTKIWELLTIYGLKVIAAVVVYIVGRWIAKGFGRLCVRMLTKRNFDPTLVSFAGSMTHIGLLVLFSHSLAYKQPPLSRLLVPPVWLSVLHYRVPWPTLLQAF